MRSVLRETVEAKQPGAYAQIHAADPAMGKEAVAWLGALFLADKLNLDDLAKVKRYLRLHDQHLRGTVSRNFEAYDDVPALFRAVAPLIPKHPPAVDRYPNDAEVLELFNDGKLRVVVPMTAAASERQGADTEWCTAFTSAPSCYWRYAVQGPLFIVMDKSDPTDVQKYQLHLPQRQWRNSANKDYAFRELLKEYPPLGAVLASYFNERLDHEIASARSVDVDNVMSVQTLLGLWPTSMRDANMKDTANTIDELHGDFSRRPPTLKLSNADQKIINNIYQNMPEPDYLVMIARDPHKLLDIPLQRQSKVVLAAAAARGFIPSDRERYLEAVRRDPAAMKCIIREYPDLRHEAVAVNGEGLFDIPHALQNAQICKTAVAANPAAWVHAAPQFITEDFLEDVATRLPLSKFDQRLYIRGGARPFLPRIHSDLLASHAFREKILCISGKHGMFDVDLEKVDGDLRTQKLFAHILAGCLRVAAVTGRHPNIGFMDEMPNDQQLELSNAAGLEQGFDGRGIFNVKRLPDHAYFPDAILANMESQHAAPAPIPPQPHTQYPLVVLARG